MSEGSAAPSPGVAPHPPLGVVLCGGASRRMGRDKATMGDPPWAHRVADTLQRAGCDPVVLLGEPPVARTDLDRLRAGGWELVEDCRAVMRKVEIGAIEADRALVEGGLTVGEELVVSGQRDLADGQAVRTEACQ